MQKLIAFTGKAGSGKDTAADYLVSKYRYQKEFFALKMKEGIVTMFDLDRKCIFGSQEDKERAIPKLSKTKTVNGRLLLQTIGTDWGRNMIYPDIWIADIANKWNNLKNIPGFAGMVISDLRFNNEAEWVKSQGGVVIELYSEMPHEITCAVSGDRPLLHASENGIDRKLISGSIYNPKNNYPALYKDIEMCLVGITASTLYFDTPARRKEDKDTDIRTLIVEWADGVFPNRTISNVIQKMVLHELPEYLMKQDDPMELADIGILLYDIANLAGIDLDDAIRKKMVINKARKWGIDKVTGLMSHVKTPVMPQNLPFFDEDNRD